MTETKESYDSGADTVPTDVFLPDASGARVPGVLVIHGSSGLAAQYKADIVSFANALAANGIGAVLPHYFAAAKLPADTDGLPLIDEHYTTWKAACKDALLMMARDARFDVGRLGLLGFSLGGHYALSLALDPPSGTSIKCVVEFFAPTLSPALAGPWSRMPPLLVHHGRDDRLIEPGHSLFLKQQLESARKREGTDFEIKWYDGQGHGFTDDAATKSLSRSRTATVDFFVRHL